MSNKGYSRKGKYRNDKSKIGDKGREVLEQIDENNRVMVMFRNYAAELDLKHDRHERIVKLSRDITIESKRIIFSLHNVAVDLENKKEHILNDAKNRLEQIIEKNFKAIALELEEQDPYLYQRAYTAGLQEFVEAFLYYQYLKQGYIEPVVNLQQKFFFSISVEPQSDAQCDEQTDNLVISNRNIHMIIPMQDFFLGLADFTGELMRRCINNLSSGNIQDCFKICNFVRSIYVGFLGVNYVGCKELGRKVFVLKQSVSKMEYVCYTIQVRGSEIPKHMLAAVITNVGNTEVNQDEDEGYF